jgi:hypothetical protein
VGLEVFDWGLTGRGEEEGEVWGWGGGGGGEGKVEVERLTGDFADFSMGSGVVHDGCGRVIDTGNQPCNT